MITEFLLFLIFLAILFKDIPSTKGIEQELHEINRELELLRQKKK